MTLDEFMDYYKEEYGNEGLRRLPERMKRVNETGTSDGVSRLPLERWIECNRAGENESQATLEQIADKYIRNRPKGDEQ